MALIRRIRGEESLWLTRWNEKWAAFHLVGGHRHVGESFRDCMIRELHEELGLRVRIGSDSGCEPPTRLVYSARSASAGVVTRYTVALFRIDPGELDGRALESRAEVRWLSEGEIRRGRCDDGRPVSPTTDFLLTKAGLL